MFFLKKEKKKHAAIKRFMEATMKIDFDFEKFSKHNIFNKLSLNSEYGFYYFPYGYLFRHPRWGKINELGFRQDCGSHEVKSKYPDHIIVTVFGASNAFSILVKDSDSFSQKLEKKLNDDENLKKKLNKKFKVLNFSQPANTMLNQIINYNLYAYPLNPEIVISHGGVCDFHYGQISDSFLLNNYDITYVEIAEAWGKIIHDSKIEIAQDYVDENNENFKPVKVKNNPKKIIDSFHNRSQQFKKMVESNGSIFINSLEPFLYSKKSYSNEEKEKIKIYFKYYHDVYNNMKKLFDDYEKKYLNTSKIDYNINFHKIFNNFDSTVTHFGDIIHTLEAGEEIISNEYYKKILKKYSIE